MFTFSSMRLYRNNHAGELLEYFLIAAVATVLLVRFYLEQTNYPQIGGDYLHIAHMLPGGILMVVGIIMLITFFGNRAQSIAILISGVGFGLFIDELGKFITKDNNYFFQPTIAFLYIIFIILFLLFRLLSNHSKLQPDEYLMNAMNLMEEGIVRKLDASEYKAMIHYLHEASLTQPISHSLRELAETVIANKPSEGSYWLRIKRQLHKFYKKMVISQWGIRIITTIFILQAITILISIQFDFVRFFSQPLSLLVPAISSIIAAIISLFGAIKLRKSRFAAYKLFRLSMLVTLLVTQSFWFYNKQLGNLPDLLVVLGLYAALQILIKEEQSLV